MNNAEKKLNNGGESFIAPKTGRSREVTGEFELAEPGIESAGTSKNPEGLEKHEDRQKVKDGVSIVCDGAGAHKGAELAASIASEAVWDKLKKYKDTPVLSSKEAEDTMAEAIQEANAKILRMKMLPGYEDMATTLSATMLYWDKDTREVKAAIGQVGDSRVYLYDKLNGQGDLKQISPEDSVLGELAEMGVFINTEGDLATNLGEALDKMIGEAAAEDVNKGKPTPLGRKLESFRSYFDKKIDPIEGVPMSQLSLKILKNRMTRALGQENVKPHVLSSGPLKEGQLLIVCSDGVTDGKSDKKLLEKMNAISDLEPAEIASGLANFAVADMDGVDIKKDNTSVNVTKINKLVLPEEEIILKDEDLEEIKEDFTEEAVMEGDDDFDIDIVLEDNDEGVEEDERGR